jgi:hypothetical protein
MEAFNVLATKLLVDTARQVDCSKDQQHIPRQALQELEYVRHCHVLHRRTDFSLLLGSHAFANLLGRIGRPLDEDEREEPDVVFRDTNRGGSNAEQFLIV